MGAGRLAAMIVVRPRIFAWPMDWGPIATARQGSQLSPLYLCGPASNCGQQRCGLWQITGDRQEFACASDSVLRSKCASCKVVVAVEEGVMTVVVMAVAGVAVVMEVRNSCRSSSSDELGEAGKR